MNNLVFFILSPALLVFWIAGYLFGVLFKAFLFGMAAAAQSSISFKEAAYDAVAKAEDKKQSSQE